ncbi:hypothetical protein FB192DRAFT_1449478 [Mucor lusitanicus]|uniref:Uncharacterized protein n=2 Tax=Mucor circinelloides f. lusitanicus TaxID=29924 RepID=A0A162RIX4_MUCCL|nr:hypothetical protein FB192DRAFT_1449478 [Mucor lusitanicus]OAD06389.1 hypothetical protein MUCCIDRAFT_106963 [Mucor lusitanicus CBS 277.49]
MYNGVRAEPKFLRDPTSFESISSGISRISSYVTSNLPKRKSSSMPSPFDPHYQQYQAQQQAQQQQQQAQQQQPAMVDDVLDDMDDADTITFASFEKLEYRDKTMSCLLLGYHDGFQLWDITNPDNVHELVSIRDKEAFGVVSFIHIVQGQQEPVLAIISETTTTTPSHGSNEQAQTHNRMSSNSSTSTTSTMASSHLILYSLQTQSIIKEINDFGEEENDDTVVVTCIKSNHKVIVLGCLSRHRSSLRILSAADYTPFATPLTDIYHDPNQGPIFTLGSRFIAYATNTAVLNSDPVMTSLTNKSISYSVLQGDKDVKGAAKDIAKEVVSGMKTLGEFGFNTLQNYFGNQPPSQPHQGPPAVPAPQEIYDASSSSNRRTASLQTSSPKDNLYLNSSSSSNSAKKMVPSGMIMIRDILKLPKTPTRNLSLSIIAHFRPHTHPVSCLAFNQAGTLLMSASKQGHTFHIFSILTNTAHGNASHLYSLSRGITDAQVVDCQFSVDSTWCAITTARGTTHVYAINPYGGKPEISGHVHGKVNNPVYHPFMAHSSKSKPKATTLSSVVRIKQRRKMPGNSLSSSQDDLGKYVGQPGQNPSGYSHGYYGPTPPQYIPSMMPPPSAIIHRNISKEPRAKIVAMFVTASKSPYLVNNSVYKNSLSSHNSLSSNSDSPNANPLGSIKQQATSMLSSFGSNLSHLPYLPTSTSQQAKKWDRNNSSSDTLMFGFDEEYDDSTKMINDEVGYQDMYSFHPDGVLTLHRCWVAKTVVKKRENGRTLEKLDLSLKEEDVAEWRVARNADWDQVRLSVDPALAVGEEEDLQGSKKKKNKASSQSQKQTFAVDTRKKKLWLSNAEITTYTNDEPALWTHHQFSFQTYHDTKDLQRVLNAGMIPKTDTMIMLKGMPEPVSSRIDRVRKTTTRIANDSVEENMDDAIAELEDNLSKAMQTSFSPSSNSMGNSPATNLKWLSSSANAAMNASPSPSMTNKSFMDRNSSLSFEDAYLINMGSGPSPEPSMHGHTPQQQQPPPLQTLDSSSLIQFDDDEDEEDNSIHHLKGGIDVIRLEGDDEDADEHRDATKPSHAQQQQQSEVYSPDGDNEVEYPYESVYENLHHQRAVKEDSDDEDDNQVPW